MTLIWTIVGFVTGAMPFSLWLGQKLARADVRHFGDGNPGAANAWLAGGWRVGIISGFSDLASTEHVSFTRLLPVCFCSGASMERKGSRSAHRDSAPGNRHLGRASGSAGFSLKYVFLPLAIAQQGLTSLLDPRAPARGSTQIPHPRRRASRSQGRGAPPGERTAAKRSIPPGRRRQ
jgi:hypothetical protein